MSVLVVSGGSTIALNEPLWYPSAQISLGAVSTLSTDLADPDYVYRTQPSVRTVLGFVARNVAQVAMHAFGVTDAGDRQRLERSHDLSRLLRSPGGAPSRGMPSAGVTAFRHMHDLVTDLGLWDRYAALKVRDAQGRVMLRRLPPRQWRFRRDGLDQPIALEFSPPGVGKVVPIDLAACLWFDGYPHSESLVTSPMEGLQALLAEQSEATQYRAELWANGAKMSGWISRPLDAPPWSKSARSSFRTAWRDAYTGSGSRVGGTPMLEEGMEFHPVEGVTPEQAQQIEARKLSISEVAAYYYVPPVFVGILDNANYSNVSAYRQMLYDDVLGPMLRSIEHGYQDRLVPDLGDPDEIFVEFNVHEKLRLSFEEQARVLQTATGAPIMARNEARQRVNLPRIEKPEYDDIITPLNVSTGDASSLTLSEQIDAATALIRAGFEPEAALALVGLDPITHLGLVPITVKPPEA